MEGGSLHCTGDWDQDHPQEKKMQKGLFEEALKIAVKRGETKKERRKGKIYPLECTVQKNSRET